MLPYASDCRPTRRPIVTLTLMGVMIAVSFWLWGASKGWWSANKSVLFANLGFLPARPNPLALLTYPFLHDGWGHLIINLLYLWFFGAGVEEAVARWKYFALFLAGGAVGGALQWLVITTLVPSALHEPVVGASASCAGLMGVFAVRYYRTRLNLPPSPFRPHVVSVVFVFLAFEILIGGWNLLRGTTAYSVANWAHVGGFVFGLGVAHLMRLTEAGHAAYLHADATLAMAKSVPGEAIRRWEMLLTKEPNNAHAMSELGRAWLLLGDTEQANHHFQNAIQTYLEQNKRDEAALVYAEMRDVGCRESGVPVAQLFTLGLALEDMEQFSLAAEVLRGVWVRHPETPEAETALLKVIGVYVHRLRRAEEATILARLFLERYPHSSWRGMADSLLREAQHKNSARLPDESAPEERPSAS